MRKIIFFAAALIVVAPAIAQTVPQAPSQPPAKSFLDQVVEEWTASNLAQRHLADKIAGLGQDWEQKGAQLVAAQQRVRNLEAYAKACGDKPGCFTEARDEIAPVAISVPTK